MLDVIFDLFVELKATDEQLDFPIIYASAKNGFAMRELHENNEDMTPLFQAIVQHVPPPKISSEPFFQMLVSNLDYSDYLGSIALGRIVSGRVAVGDSIVCIQRDGRRERATVTALFTFAGLEQVEMKHASAGDIIGLTGFEEVYIGETLTDREERPPLQFVDIDPPTIRMHILVNDSPFAGREGKFVTARHVRERLIRETRGNVSLQISDTETAGAFEINARGEMQIAILVEQMRREGYEVMVSRPEVIFQRDENGNLLEPLENLYVDVPNENLGDVLQSLADRKGEIVSMDHHASRVSVEAIIPTRGLIGFETRSGQPDSRRRADESSLPRICALQRRDWRTQSRRDGFDGTGSQHGLRAEQYSGAREAFHRPAGRHLRRNDRGRERAAGRSPGQSLQGEASYEHAQPGGRQRHSTGSAAPHDSRARHRIHRRGRICGSDPEIAAAAQAHPRRNGPEAGAERSLNRLACFVDKNR